MATTASPQSSNQKEKLLARTCRHRSCQWVAICHTSMHFLHRACSQQAAGVSSRPHLICVQIQGPQTKYSLAGDRLQLAGTLCTASMQASADCAADCHNLADMKVTPPLHQPPRSQRFCASTKVFAFKLITFKTQVHICNRDPDKLKHCPHYNHEQVQVRGSAASR